MRKVPAAHVWMEEQWVLKAVDVEANRVSDDGQFTMFTSPDGALYVRGDRFEELSVVWVAAGCPGSRVSATDASEAAKLVLEWLAGRGWLGALPVVAQRALVFRNGSIVRGRYVRLDPGAMGYGEELDARKNSRLRRIVGVRDLVTREVSHKGESEHGW